MIHLPERYQLKIKDKKIESIKLNREVVKTFKKPVTHSKCPKLYAVKSKGEVIYIGITSQSIRNRLNYGLQAEGEQGYYGYKWKNLKDVEVYIWCFPKKKPAKVEAIEAELVYLFRKNKHKWPKYQTEIHFHNASNKEKETANSIFNILNQ